MRFVAGRGAGSEQERWHKARVLLRSKDAAVAERLVRCTAVAERHREDVACCGTADAEPAGKGTAGTEDCWPVRRCRARALPRVCGAERRCGGARAPPRSTSGQQSASAAAGQWRWQKARSGAGRQILSDSPSDLAITSAAQVLPYVFTAVRGISQSCCTARTNPMPSKGNPTT